MFRPPLLLRPGSGYLVDWLQGASSGIPRKRVPQRTVYDVQARKYVELPLPEFQRLLQLGQIEEADSRTPHLWRRQKVYRLLSW
jgi:hypothetical protein